MLVGFGLIVDAHDGQYKNGSDQFEQVRIDAQRQGYGQHRLKQNTTYQDEYQLQPDPPDTEPLD
jgi:hypothetical protein